MTNKTHKVIEKGVARLTKLAYPQDLGKPTSDLENQIRAELEKLVEVTRAEERMKAIYEVEEDMEMIAKEIDRLRERDEEGDEYRRYAHTHDYAMLRHTLTTLTHDVIEIDAEINGNNTGVE